MSLVAGEITDERDAPGTACSRLWLDAMFLTSNPHELRIEVPTKTRAVDVKVPNGKLIATYEKVNHRGAHFLGRGTHDHLWETPKGLVRVEDIYQALRVRVLTHADPDAARSLLDEVRDQVAPPAKQKKNEVKVKFWRMTPQGGSAFTRQIEAPTWRAIERNYSKDASTQLGQLMKLKPRQLGTGKIILLHGPAGTGKTTAIRAIAREWQKWCDLGYAIDPERVFGSGEYLTTLIADEDSSDDEAWMPQSLAGQSSSPQGSKWRLIVIEDAEEFLVPDAKHEVGQAVSRLLNVGDGILGQGLKLLVMLTTNVPVDKLSPAITRAGRCLANIEVPPLTKLESAAWIGHDVDGPMTLAELWESAHPSQIGTGIGAKERPGQYL